MANIREYLNNIKNAIFGKDVRSSIHDGIDAINNEVISNTTLTNNTKVRQDLLENKYDEQIRNIAASEPQSPEIVDARNGFDTLGNIISKKTYFFNTVAEMKACSKLKNGDCVQTLGYYSANDGGGGTYQVVNDSTLVDDGGSVHNITNGLRAKIIIKDNTINIKQLGAVSQKNSTKYDIASYIEKYFNIMEKYERLIKLYIPTGVWHCSPVTLVGNYGFSIFGDKSFAFLNKKCNGTIITSLYDNQTYIFNIGDTNHTVAGWTLEDIVFSSADMNYDNQSKIFKYDRLKKIDTCVKFHYAEFGITNNLFFLYINGQAMSINASWEIYFGLLNFRCVTNHNGCVLNFETADENLSEYANITACNFEKIMFEWVHGHLINFEKNSRVYNNHFGVINFEDHPFINDNEIYTTYNDEILEEFNDDTAVHYAVFNFEDEGKFAQNVINSIELNNVSMRYFIWNENIYTYDTIINYANFINHANVYNNITLNGSRKNCKVIRMHNISRVNNYSSYSIFNNFNTDSSKNFIFELAGLNDIIVNGNPFGVNVFTPNDGAKTCFYEFANWIPCYVAKPKISYSGSGLGSLFTDEDSATINKICVKPRTETNNLSNYCFTTCVNIDKKLCLRAKVPNGETVRTSLDNRSRQSVGIPFDLVGTGNFEIYEKELPDEWKVGDQITLVISINANYSKNILLDCFRSF